MKRNFSALAKLFGALAEKKRLAILAYLLRRGERCVCHIQADLKLSQSMASRHLACLQRAGLLLARRAGVWVHYRPNLKAAGSAGQLLVLLAKGRRRQPQRRKVKP